MKITPLHCPNCGATLQIKDMHSRDGTAHCEHCGNAFIIEREPPAPPPRPRYEPRSAPIRGPTQREKYGAKNKTGETIAVVILMLVIAGLFLSLTQRGKSDYAMVSEMPALAAARRTVPESMAVRDFVFAVFNKDASDITQEELAQIKYLDIDTGDYFTPGSYEPWRSDRDDLWTFTYSRADYFADTADFEATLETVFIAKTMEDIELADLQCFTGLTWLEINRSSDFSGRDVNLAPLTELRHVGVGYHQSVTELAQVLTAPAQIRSLAIALKSQSDVEALARFTALEELTIHSVFDAVTNISAISAVTTLKRLIIDSIDDISWLSVLPSLTSLTLDTSLDDYSVLYGMPSLEELYITYASELRDLGFVRSLPRLRVLELHSSSIISLEPLRDTISLQVLRLERNRSLQSLDALATLTSLRELYIDEDDAEYPSLAALTHLRTAGVPINKLGAIAELSEITTLLALENWPTSEPDFSELLQFPNVSELLIESVDKFSNIDALSGLENLKTLRLDDVPLTRPESFAAIFNLPHLEVLELRGCNLGIDTATLAPAETLQRLSFRNCGAWRFYDGKTLLQEFSDAVPLTETLAQMTQLRILELPNVMLEDISFLAGLTALEVLDISKNYVTDMAALAPLSELYVLFCMQNPVRNLAMLREGVFVYA